MTKLDSLRLSAIILAGGSGMRMRPLTESKPKPLLLFLGKPLLCWSIEAVYPVAREIVVATRVFPRQFDDVPLSYPKVRLVETSAQDKLDALWECVDGISGDYVLCTSADVAYRSTAVLKVAERMVTTGASVGIALKKFPRGGRKNWRWDIAGEDLKDIAITDSPTGIEHFFLICRTEILARLRDQIREQTCGGDSAPSRFGKGWICLIKNLLDAGIAVRAFMLNDEYLHYVNRPTDLNASGDDGGDSLH